MTNKYTIFGFFLPFAYMLCCDICMTNSGTRRPVDFKESKNVDLTTFLANLKENVDNIFGSNHYNKINIQVGG